MLTDLLILFMLHYRIVIQILCRNILKIIRWPHKIFVNKTRYAQHCPMQVSCFDLILSTELITDWVSINQTETNNMCL